MKLFRLSAKKIFSIFLVFSVLFGIFLRISNIEGKTFWYDEAYTAIPVAGYTKRDVKEDWLRLVQQSGTPLTAADLKRYQTPQPQTTAIDTLTSVGAEEAHNSPLYFVLARLSLDITGLSTIIAMRGLSVLFGILAIAGGYVLCYELFSDRLTSYFGAALIATSPFHIIYAQEARQYSLLTVFVLFSSAQLLRSIKSERSSDWLRYGVLVTLGLYTQFLFLLVSLAHGAYMFMGQFKESPFVKKQYLKATAWSSLIFFPWLLVILLSLGSIADWRKTTVLSLPRLWGRWALNIVRAIYDMPLSGANQYDFMLNQTDPDFWLMLLILALIVISFGVLIRTAPKRSWLLVLFLAAIPSLPFMALDVISGGVRSAIPRYFIPAYLAIELAIAYFLGYQIRKTQKPVAAFLAISLSAWLVILGGMSSIKLVYADTWWSKYSNVYDQSIAAVVNKSPKAVVMGDVATRLIALSYSLQEDVEVILADIKEPIILPEDQPVFVYASDDFIANLGSLSHRCLDNVYEQPLFYTDKHVQLWQLKACQ